MKFIVFISDTIRQGQYPRLEGFSYSKEYDKYLYLGRELSIDEFNAAAKLVFNPSFRNQGFSLQPLAIEPMAAPAPNLRLEGQRIYDGATHIAGLFGEKHQLRVMNEYSSMRPAIEDWLSNTLTAQPL